MQLQIIKQELLTILQLAQDASEKDNINSYYSYFVLSAKQNILTIKSASRQLSFEQFIESNEYTKLEISEDGEFLVPGTKFFNIVNSLHDGVIILYSKDVNLHIKEQDTKKSNIKFSIRMRRLEDYPQEIHQTNTKKFCDIDTEKLLLVITNTRFAVSSNLKDTAMFLTGIFFDIQDNTLTTVATDRNRMSISKVQIEDLSLFKNSYDKDIIVPLKSTQFIRKILKLYDNEKTCSAVIDGEKMFLTIGTITISANLISGQYYDYKRIIPKESRNKIVVNAAQLREAIMRVTIANENIKENNVSITTTVDALLISAEEKEKSKANESIVASLEGKENSFIIKAEFILDPLRVIDSEEVHIDYGDNVRDLIKITSPLDKDTIHIAAQLNQ